MSTTFLFNLPSATVGQNDAVVVGSDEPIIQLTRIDEQREEYFGYPKPAVEEKPAASGAGGKQQAAPQNVGQRIKSVKLPPDKVEVNQFARAIGGSPDPLFCSDQPLNSAIEPDSNFNWACRAFTIRRSQSQSLNARIPTHQDDPPQPAYEELARELGEESTLYLFNVIVALEWDPDEAQWTQLKWAFRRASDFLYDVTDGQMAFGQVFFGGLELMDAADIQIMASDRLYPRSWVGGIFDPTTNRPIRVGRGMWHRRNRILIPWDEPEGYRTLVHEWGHYALRLHDLYLAPGEGGNESQGKQTSTWIPAIRIPSTSIMASLEGTSELTISALEEGTEEGTSEPSISSSEEGTSEPSISSSEEGTSEPSISTSAAGASERTTYTFRQKKREWERMKEFYPKLREPTNVSSGPGRLPLPLPSYRHHERFISPLRSRRINLYANLNGWPMYGEQNPLSIDATFPIKIEDANDAANCWIYVLKSAERGTDLLPHIQNATLTSEHQPRLYPQGTLDARYENRFPLLNAEENDIVIVVYCPKQNDAKDGKTKVGEAKVASTTDGLTRSFYAKLPINSVDDWKVCSDPVNPPLIDVTATNVASGQGADELSIRVRNPPNAGAMAVWLFPLGQSMEQKPSVVQGTFTQTRAPGTTEVRLESGGTDGGTYDDPGKIAEVEGDWVGAVQLNSPNTSPQQDLAQRPDGDVQQQQEVFEEAAQSNTGQPIFDQPQNTQLLDGTILVLGGKNQLFLATYSLGGNTPGHSPEPTTPISAGSSDGDVLIFFREKDTDRRNTLGQGTPGQVTSGTGASGLGTFGQGASAAGASESGTAITGGATNEKPDISKLRVLTTFNQWRGGAMTDATMSHASYVYTITTSQKLSDDVWKDYAPTLVMFYDVYAEDQQTDPVMQYYDVRTKQWSPVPEATAYPSNSFVAVTLTDLEHVRHYRLCWPKKIETAQPPTIPPTPTGDPEIVA